MVVVVLEGQGRGTWSSRDGVGNRHLTQSLGLIQAVKMGVLDNRAPKAHCGFWRQDMDPSGGDLATACPAGVTHDLGWGRGSQARPSGVLVDLM